MFLHVFFAFFCASVVDTQVAAQINHVGLQRVRSFGKRNLEHQNLII
jgi:hypothetical protein